METTSPIIAIVGSARTEIMGDSETAARNAAQALGFALANEGWRIAVYGSNKDYIEHDVVIGYVGAEKKVAKSIICTRPLTVEANFEAMKEHPEYFEINVDTSPKWEVSFYRSILSVDAILLFGGKDSAFVAGQIALARNLPTIAVGSFPGASQIIWQNHLSGKSYIDSVDISTMGNWVTNSAKDMVYSLTRQYNKLQKELAESEKKKQEEIKKAHLWDQYMEDQKKGKGKTIRALIFLILTLICSAIGLIPMDNIQGWKYSLTAFLGLCIAGGMGATIRMISPTPADAIKKWDGLIIGIMVGFMFSIIYLIPQLVQDSGFLILKKNQEITNPVRVQFICSIVVAALAGLGFDYALEQLLKKSKQSSDDLTKGSIGGT